MTTKVEKTSPMILPVPTLESEFFSFLETEQKKEKAKCVVCQEVGDGFHFGAEACRAGAAFFRRSVSLNKKYVCRGSNDCDIAANVRCMCRSCRFTKCLDVGMNPAGVQQRRDNIGKRDIKPDLDMFLALNSIGDGLTFPTTSHMNPLVDNLPPAVTDRMPLLGKMRENYRKMDNARLVIHREDGQSLFKLRNPKAANYKEAADQSIREVSLVADWISWCFDDFVALPIDQKKVLFRNFYTPFSMLEGAFLCHINDTSEAIILPSGDYIDMMKLDKFFYDPDAEQPMTADEIKKMFQPSFDLHRRALILPMMIERIDVFELFALCILILWDFGLDDQTDECMMTGKKVKDQVMKELALYLRTLRFFLLNTKSTISEFLFVQIVSHMSRRLAAHLQGFTGSSNRHHPRVSSLPAQHRNDNVGSGTERRELRQQMRPFAPNVY